MTACFGASILLTFALVQTEKLTPSAARKKIEKFCAYQERHQEEVRSKLYSYGLISDDVEEIISELIQYRFLNEERFAKAYCGGKFRQKKWGRLKIMRELKMRKISERNIKIGLQEIDPYEYEKTLISLIEKLKIKYKGIGVKDWQKKQKIISALMSKGYESDMIVDVLNENT
ncbi:MAG: RecX family transcriptional regulator [Bacteroidia bacterium]|nr:RecX family transcriptional regulator [Bacteroidia bacterium]